MRWVIMITMICWLPIGPTYGAGRGGGGHGGAHYGAGTNSYGPSYVVTHVNTPMSGFVSTYTVHTNPGPVVHGSGPHNTVPFHNHNAASKIYHLHPGPNGVITLPSRK